MYRSFSATTDEKGVVGDHILDVIEKKIPSNRELIRIYDAGMGDAKILARVLRGLAVTHPDSEVLVVAKETSLEDVRIGLGELSSVFVEQPKMVLNVTNIPFRESSVHALYQRMYSNLMDKESNGFVNLLGSSGLGYCRQIEQFRHVISQRWATQKVSTALFPVTPSMITVCKNSYMRKAARTPSEDFDVVIASQPFRNSASAKFKCRYVLSPLAQLLRPGGVMIVAHSSGGDPGEDILRSLQHLSPQLQSIKDWFPTDTDSITRELLKQSPLHLQVDEPVTTLKYRSMLDDTNEFRPASSGIESCPVELAWSTVAYVAQLSERDSSEISVAGGPSTEATSIISERLRYHGGLWFNTQAICISRCDARIDA